MSQPAIEISETGAAKAAHDVEQLGVRAGDVMPVWPELDAMFRDDERQRFDRRGPGWAQLDTATQDAKARLGQDPRVLRATDTLYRSLTAAAGVPEVGAMPGTLHFGTDVEYARFHQYGTVNMPRRTLIDLSPRTRDRMVETVSDYIVEGKR